MSKPKFIKDSGYKISGIKKKVKIKLAIFECPICKEPFEAVKYMVTGGTQKNCVKCTNKKTGDRVRTHGMSTTSIYSKWNKEMNRCFNPNSPDWDRYGGRGITVVEEFRDFQIWYNYVSTLDGFENHEELNLTIDRIDNNGNYERGNLRWATKQEQSINQRRGNINETGYQGIRKHNGKVRPSYRAWLKMFGKMITIGSYHTIKEAVEARNKYIIDNNLPHLIQEYVEVDSEEHNLESLMEK